MTLGGKLVITLAALLGTALATATCTTDFVPLSATPTGDEVLSNARRAARDLNSYVAVRTTVEATVFPQAPAQNVLETRADTFEVESADRYRVDQPAYDSEIVSHGKIVYSRYGTGEWEQSPRTTVIDGDFLLPGEEERAPAHPINWLDERSIVNPRYVNEVELAGKQVHVVSAQIPMLPTAGEFADEFPVDELVFFIDAESFQVLRIEVDLNIRDSLREDTGYQVIPGVVEIETVEIYKYSRHNEGISIPVPTLAPGA